MRREGKIRLCLKTFGMLMGLEENEEIKWASYNSDQGRVELTIRKIHDNSVLDMRKVVISTEAVEQLIALPENAWIHYAKMSADGLIDSVSTIPVLDLYIGSKDGKPIEGLVYDVAEAAETPISEMYLVADNTVGELKMRIYEQVRNALIVAIPEEENIFIDTSGTK